MNPKHTIPSLPPVRRIITAINEKGQSYIVTDGESPATRTLAERPGYRVTNLWRTMQTPASITAQDSIAQHQGVAPPSHGTILRIIDIPPEASDPELRKRQAAVTFGTLFSDAVHRLEDKRHPGMHVTRSVDYAIVIEGEITAILDKDETIMHAGDVLIQRGTNHAWANHSGKMARVAFVLIDGNK